jgi:amidase
MLNPPLPEKVKKIGWTSRRALVRHVTLPYEPFIGTIGTAPEIEAISSLQPDYYGGNMDLPDMAPGAIVYLPVNTPGGYLYLGDCHAIQGDGELCGVALEMPATVEIADRPHQGPREHAWPQLETEDRMAFIGSARPMEDAIRIAYRELVRWVAAETGQARTEAYLLLTMCGKVRLGNMVDPKYTLGRRWYPPSAARLHCG